MNLTMCWSSCKRINMQFYSGVKHWQQYDTLLWNAYIERRKYEEANGNKSKCLLEEGGEYHWERRTGDQAFSFLNGWVHSWNRRHGPSFPLKSPRLPVAASLTVMNDAPVCQLLHQFDCCLSVGSLFVLNQPVNQLFCDKAVWVGFEMMSPIFNNLFFMQPEPGKKIWQSL